MNFSNSSETSLAAIPELSITNGSGLSDPPSGRDRIAMSSIWDADRSSCIPVGCHSVMSLQPWEHWLCWSVRTTFPSFARIRDTYGRTDVDKDGTPGHFGRDPMEISDKYGGEWQTTDFQMGDVIIFTMHTMHSSTKNLSDRWRISCDIPFPTRSRPD